jgi:8-oxo-dGTP pyrophosphatase MutT (NUDIX family)
MSADWPALQAARARDDAARLPFLVLGDGRPRATRPGAPARPAPPARRAPALRIDDEAVTLLLAPAERAPFFAEANAALHRAGLIRGWRDETYPVLALADQRLLATFERAASRFWGTLTFGAHCNGFVAGDDGRPAALWIARRSATKATDPGRLDNLVGGGVPWGQTAAQTVLREGWEEAGLTPQQMAGIRPGRVFEVARDIAEGFQRERISVFDLALPPALHPHNQDGEVDELTLRPMSEALAIAAGTEMTVDAALVTLDFALRHALLAAPEHTRLERLSRDLWLTT